MNENLGQTPVPIDDVIEVVFGRDTEDRGDIASGVFVEYQHFAACRGHCRGDVGDRHGLATPSLPAAKVMTRRTPAETAGADPMPGPDIQPRRPPMAAMPALAITNPGSTPSKRCGDASGASLNARCNR